jgi:hypothetical protein
MKRTISFLVIGFAAALAAVAFAFAIRAPLDKSGVKAWMKIAQPVCSG